MYPTNQLPGPDKMTEKRLGTPHAADIAHTENMTDARSGTGCWSVRIAWRISGIRPTVRLSEAGREFVAFIRIKAMSSLPQAIVLFTRTISLSFREQSHTYISSPIPPAPCLQSTIWLAITTNSSSCRDRYWGFTFLGAEVRRIRL